MSYQAIGIDSGLHGALAIISEESVSTLDTPLLGLTDIDVPKVMHFLFDQMSPTHRAYCMIEKAQTMPKQGIVSAFNYGKSYGMLLACLYMKGVPFKEISPKSWKRYFGLVGSDKDESRRKAVQLYPALDLQYKKDHHKAEAMLIAHYAKIHFMGEKHD
jgi:crossover junction endodeoxyribonuclease RuvC